MRLYNTLTSQEEVFSPLEPGKVDMYVCGPTTYNYIHLGNARPLVVFDTVRRYLKYKGYEVRYIQNFTDVDDKILNKSAEEGIAPLELANKYIAEYYADADALGINRADVHPRVSEHIDDIIAAVAKLIEKGFAYEVEGDVYYRVKAFDNYGCLSHRSLEDMLAGARVEVDARKEEPADFALWKKAKDKEWSWDSPWGQGRPGWHIECSVMAMRYLGETIDIHGGGNDLIFPHHENEIAQSEALTGQKFVKYWLHNGFITVNSEKMSKSLGNFFILRDILAKYPAEAVRFYLIGANYRSPLDFDDGKLDEAIRALQRLKTTRRLVREFCAGSDLEGLDKQPGRGLKDTCRFLVMNHPEVKTRLLPFTDIVQEGVKSKKDTFQGAEAWITAVDNLRHSFIEAMDHDFNTALAMGCLFEMSREINIMLAALEKDLFANRLLIYSAGLVFTELGKILGLFEQTETLTSDLTDEVLSILDRIRNTARSEKNYGLADDIRNFLKGMNIVLEDTAESSRFIYADEADLEELINYVLKIREEFKALKDYTNSDRIRLELKKAGIAIEDTKDGTRRINGPIS